MPSHKDLLNLISEGASPREILQRLKLRPSHLKRILRGKQFRSALQLHEELAALLAGHEINAGVHKVAKRFTKLLGAPQPETVRKVCLSMLRQCLRNTPAWEREDASQSPENADPSAVIEPLEDLGASDADTPPSEDPDEAAFDFDLQAP